MTCTRPVLLAFLLSPFGMACTGTIAPGEPDPGDGAGPEPVQRPGGSSPAAPPPRAMEGTTVMPPPGAACRPSAGPAPLRRLTRFEYENTVRDLLGIDVGRPAAEFPAEEEVDGFTNNAAALGVSTLLAEKYIATAEELAARATADLPRLLACDSRLSEDACARSFIDRFGRRAFRRPLQKEEVDRFVALYTGARASWGHKAGIELTVQAFLQSTSFLYRLERTVPGEAGAAARLDGHSVATRLSYLLWGSMPDDALFAAAANGTLDTAAGVAAQARRLLADPRARAPMREFTSQWLHLDAVRGLGKDPKVYPAHDAATGPLLAEETQRFVESIVWDGDGTMSSLLTAKHTFRDAKLARFYGEDAVMGSGFVRVALDGVRRAGLLTQASFLASAAKPNDSSPILRGKFVRHQLLCEHLPDPPPDAVIVPPVPDARLTTRERFVQHAADPSCAGCHKLIDPVGLGFENYDGIGRYRTVENDRPVDASGFLQGTDVPGAFVGAIELGKRLAGSAQVRACAVTMWFRFGYGRSETDADACTMAQLTRALETSHGNLRELLVALTQTPAFLTRTSP